ncbi:MAG: RNA-binding protein [Spirochaetes bacterium RBG_16_67_19]|jgi:RNA recognition motif-containing protein|nr:MAG: RNA-binding protein [Spirochaetes bacterium RBG_16_67_19]
MAKKLYIGNLNYSTDEASIRKMFEPHGEVVSLNLITDKYTGQSKGFGFVEMASDEAAKAAIAALNGQQIDGRAIRVNEAFDKPRGDGGSRGGRDSHRW